MKVKYEIIVNGNLQKTIYPFDIKGHALNLINEWKADGRLKSTDKVVIRTTITIEDEIKY